jgi:hypothetical protein
MRKFVSSILLFILAYNIGGYAVLYSTMRVANEERVERMREDASHATATLRIAVAVADRDAVTLIRTGEFSRNGNTYDVLSSTIQGDSLIAVCAYDGDEEILNARLADHVEQTTDAPANTRTHVSAIESPVQECWLPTQDALPLYPRALVTMRDAAAPLIPHEPSLLTPPPRG